MDKDRKAKILLILSKDNCKCYEKIKKMLSSIKDNKIHLDYIIDPSRAQLERIIIKNNYICIIPFSQCCCSNMMDKQYNVISLLDDIDVNYFGTDFIRHLMLNDKFAFMKQTGIGIPTKIVNQYNYTYISKLTFPVKAILKNIRPYVKKNNKIFIINSKLEYDTVMRCIWDYNVEEVALQQTFHDFKKVTVTMIGNPPYVFFCINADSKNSEVEDSVLLGIKKQSYKLFTTFSFRDYAQFEYIYDKNGKFYIQDISLTIFSDNLMHMNSENNITLNFQEIVYSFILVNLIRKNSRYEADIIKEIISILPEDIVDNIVPLKYKQLICYKDICCELQKKSLRADEANQSELLNILQCALDAVPKAQGQYVPYLGEWTNNYDFLIKYENFPVHPQNSLNILKDSLNILNGQLRWHAPTTLHNVLPSTMFSAIIASTIINLYNPNALQKKTSAGILTMEKQIVRQFSRLIEWNIKNSSGIFTSGGKMCMTYAIKCGINRCAEYTHRRDAIVITSNTNHFSIESCCDQLGLTRNGCVRVPSDKNGTIDFGIFEQILLQKIEEGFPIACIIFSGGNTTHCNIEDVKTGNQIIENVVSRMGLPYKPFIYYDLVVGWPWLFYKNYNFKKNHLQLPALTIDKIKTTVDKIQNANLADAIGIDFHKAGFAPHTNSLYLVKDAGDLYRLSGYTKVKKNLEPYQFAFSNSRTTTSIVEAWNILQSIGIEGFQSYIANMITVSNIFMKYLPTYGFQLLDKENTYGFATIIWCAHPLLHDITFEEFTNSCMIQENNRYLYEFSSFLLTNTTSQACVRFLPKYKQVDDNIYVAALSLLPMTLNLNDQNAKIVVDRIGNIKKTFDAEYCDKHNQDDMVIPDDEPK